MEEIEGIFIAISPSHIKNFECYLEQVSEREEFRAVLLNPGNFEFNPQIWHRVLNGNMNLSYRASSSLAKLIFQIKKLWGYKKYLYRVFLYLEKGKYDFYYCNLDDVLSNIIFHQLLEREEGNYYVFEDGILNYYHPKRNIADLKKKRKFAGLFGMKFVPIPGHPTNLQSHRVKKQYVRLPEKSIVPEKSTYLPYEKIAYEPQENRVLILGQDIMHNCPQGQDYYVKRLQSLIGYVELNIDYGTRIIYKPHRNGDYSFAERELSKISNSFELFLDDNPIESCIAEIKPTKIYSFESSAMLNLKLSLDSNGVELMVLPFTMNENPLVGLYRSLGIKIIK